MNHKPSSMAECISTDLDILMGIEPVPDGVNRGAVCNTLAVNLYVLSKALTTEDEDALEVVRLVCAHLSKTPASHFDGEVDEMLDVIIKHADHNPLTCDCEYVGDNMWSCGHIDNMETP